MARSSHSSDSRERMCRASYTSVPDQSLHHRGTASDLMSRRTILSPGCRSLQTRNACSGRVVGPRTVNRGCGSWAAAARSRDDFRLSGKAGTVLGFHETSYLFPGIPLHRGEILVGMISSLTAFLTRSTNCRFLHLTCIERRRPCVQIALKCKSQPVKVRKSCSTGRQRACVLRMLSGATCSLK